MIKTNITYKEASEKLMKELNANQKAIVQSIIETQFDNMPVYYDESDDIGAFIPAVEYYHNENEMIEGFTMDKNNNVIVITIDTVPFKEIEENSVHFYKVVTTELPTKGQVALKEIKAMEGYTEYSYEKLEEIMNAEKHYKVVSKDVDYYSVGINGRNGVCATVKMKNGGYHKIKVVGRKMEIFWF